MASLIAKSQHKTWKLFRVDTQRQKWEIISFTGGQQKQTHFVELNLTIRVSKVQPVEEVLFEFCRIRRFSEFDTFRKSLIHSYPSLITKSGFPQKTWFRVGSKSKQTIKQRIFWFKQWLDELLNDEIKKGVTNPAMISAMTAHWLYGKTATDQALGDKEVLPDYNPKTDQIDRKSVV